MKKQLFLALAILFLVGCGKEKTALDEFKKSKAGEEVSECVGAYGRVDWQIFKSERVSNPDVRVIQATLKKGDSAFEIQWAYNLNTKISELMYAGRPGEKTSMFLMALDLASFCLMTGANEMKKDSFSVGTSEQPDFVIGTKYKLIREKMLEYGWRPANEFMQSEPDLFLELTKSCVTDRYLKIYPELMVCGKPKIESRNLAWYKGDKVFIAETKEDGGDLVLVQTSQGKSK